MNTDEEKRDLAPEPPQPKPFDSGESRVAQGKQPYTPPVVRVEGDIEKLTQAVGLQGDDGITGSSLGSIL